METTRSGPVMTVPLVTDPQQVAEKGPGRLNACPTNACKPLIVRGGAGGFACRFQSSEPFSAAC